MPKTGNIKLQISLGYAIIQALILGMGIVIVSTLKNLQADSANLYNHPFLVSNTALQAKAEIILMRNVVMEMALRDDPMDFPAASSETLALDKAIGADLKTIHSAFLGDMSRVNELDRQLEDWQRIRSKAFGLVAAGRKQEARQLVAGDGQNLFEKIRGNIDYVAGFAKKKAETFSEEAARESSSRMNDLYWLFGLLAALTSALVFFITRRILSELRKNEAFARRLEENENRFRILFDESNDGKLLLSSDGKITDINRTWHEKLGYAKEELIGRHIAELDPPEFSAQVSRQIEEVERKGHAMFESAHVCKDGSIISVEINARIIEIDGEVCILGVVRDISERKQLDEEKKLAMTVFQNISEALTVTDSQHRIIAVNPAFTKLTGYLAEEVLGRNPNILSSGRHDSEFYREMWQSLVETGEWQGEIWDRRKDGELIAEWLTISTIYDEKGDVSQRVALFSDITKKKQSEEMIWRQANFDPLTQLPNRNMFRERLESAIKKALRNNTVLALLFIDLDRFKEVNDTLGHHVGDELLVEAALRIVSCVRESDSVARLGGDEFTVILEGLPDEKRTERVAQEIVQKLAEPSRLEGESTYVSASIGITFYPSDASDAHSLIKNADQAMYAAKNKGRNRFSYFTPTLQEAALKRLRMAGDMRIALVEGQFRVHFQPIIDLSSGSAQKAEALLRWEHPEHGMISPMDFIPLAEETGMIVEIGDWVFREAANLAKRLDSMSFQISINASPAQFHSVTNHFDTWPDYLKALELDGSSIVLEITEGLLLDTDSGTTDRLLALRNTGLQVSLDDFGTGYSSLSYLKRYDIDYIKIDKSFVRDMTEDRNDQALCEAIVVMAHKLGMKVVAEGVETAQQRDLLHAMGCDYAQGYLFSRPVPAEELEKLLLSWKDRK